MLPRERTRHKPRISRAPIPTDAFVQKVGAKNREVFSDASKAHADFNRQKTKKNPPQKPTKQRNGFFPTVSEGGYWRKDGQIARGFRLVSSDATSTGREGGKTRGLFERT